MIRSVGIRSSLVALALVGSGCGGDGEKATDSTPGMTREEAVGAFVSEVVVPANEVAADSAEAAASAVAALCASPSEASLVPARAAVAAGWGAWRATDTFDMGPAMDRRSTSVVSYKVDPEKVDVALAATPPTDPETVRNRTSSSVRGYGAAWHLLTADAAAFAGQPQRCAYLSAVLAVIVEEAGAVRDGWTDGLDGAPAFRETATGSGSDALTPTDVIDAVVNMQLSQLETSAKLLTAVAEAEPGSTGTPTSELPVGELFQLSAQMGGFSATYDRLGDLLDPALVKTVAKEIATIERLLSEASMLPSEVDPSAADAGEVAEAVEALRSTIATEVVSALDVTVSFSENDGDS